MTTHAAPQLLRPAQPGSVRPQRLLSGRLLAERFLSGPVLTGLAVMALCLPIAAPGTAMAAGGRNPPINDGTHDPQRDQMVQANYVEAFRQMTEQLSAVMLQQLPIIGTFLDAKHQLETQRLFGAAAARAHREYHPSEQICALGTLARSTSISKFKVARNTGILNALFLKRNVLSKNSASGWGTYSDTNTRLAQFKTTYCDSNDDNTLLRTICTPAADARPNADIDYRRTIEGKMTLDLDFANGGAATADEQDVLALSKNLYNHQTLTPIQEGSIVPNGSFSELHNMRMLAAVRGVAQHSYSTMAAMRGTGSGLQVDQLSRIMQNLGVPQADIAALVGANPSYYAQMEILTQKMFQDPTFIVNLYNGPNNVARMGVVMQALKIMSDRDKFEAALRREMLLSMMVEMRLRDSSQQDVGNEVNRMKSN